MKGFYHLSTIWNVGQNGKEHFLQYFLKKTDDKSQSGFCILVKKKLNELIESPDNSITEC